jgi:hypothetical protein
MLTRAFFMSSRYNSSQKRFEGLSDLALHPVVEGVHQAAVANDLELLTGKVAKGWTEFLAIGSAVTNLTYGVCHLATHTIT